MKEVCGRNRSRKTYKVVLTDQAGNEVTVVYNEQGEAQQ